MAKKISKPISRRVYEYEHREKSNEWYVILSIVISGVAIASVVLGNYLFAVLALVAGLAIGVHAGKRPEIVSFEVGREGIRSGDRLYRYEHIESFWVETEFPQPMLFVESKRLLLPLIIIPLDETKTKLVRDALSGQLLEKKHTLSPGHSILDYFGF